MKKVVREQHGVSLTRLLAAFLSCGLSVPFLGVRRVTRTTIRWK